MACWYRPLAPVVDIQVLEKLRNELKVLDQDEKGTILVGDTQGRHYWGGMEGLKHPPR